MKVPVDVDGQRIIIHANPNATIKWLVLAALTRCERSQAGQITARHMGDIAEVKLALPSDVSKQAAELPPTAKLGEVLASSADVVQIQLRSRGRGDLRSPHQLREMGAALDQHGSRARSVWETRAFARQPREAPGVAQPASPAPLPIASPPERAEPRSARTPPPAGHAVVPRQTQHILSDLLVVPATSDAEAAAAALRARHEAMAALPATLAHAAFDGPGKLAKPAPMATPFHKPPVCKWVSSSADVLPVQALCHVLGFQPAQIQPVMLEWQPAVRALHRVYGVHIHSAAALPRLPPLTWATAAVLHDLRSPAAAHFSSSPGAERAGISPGALYARAAASPRASSVDLRAPRSPRTAELMAAVAAPGQRGPGTDASWAIAPERFAVLMHDAGITGPARARMPVAVAMPSVSVVAGIAEPLPQAYLATAPCPWRVYAAVVAAQQLGGSPLAVYTLFTVRAYLEAAWAHAGAESHASAHNATALLDWARAQLTSPAWTRIIEAMGRALAEWRSAMSAVAAAAADSVRGPASPGSPMPSTAKQPMRTYDSRRKLRAAASSVARAAMFSGTAADELAPHVLAAVADNAGGSVQRHAAKSGATLGMSPQVASALLLLLGPPVAQWHTAWMGDTPPKPKRSQRPMPGSAASSAADAWSAVRRAGTTAAESAKLDAGTAAAALSMLGQQRTRALLADAQHSRSLPRDVVQALHAVLEAADDVKVSPQQVALRGLPLLAGNVHAWQLIAVYAHAAALDAALSYHAAASKLDAGASPRHDGQEPSPRCAAASYIFPAVFQVADLLQALQPQPGPLRWLLAKGGLASVADSVLAAVATFEASSPHAADDARYRHSPAVALLRGLAALHDGQPCTSVAQRMEQRILHGPAGSHHGLQAGSPLYREIQDAWTWLESSVAAFGRAREAMLQPAFRFMLERAGAPTIALFHAYAALSTEAVHHWLHQHVAHAEADEAWRSKASGAQQHHLAAGRGKQDAPAARAAGAATAAATAHSPAGSGSSGHSASTPRSHLSTSMLQTLAHAAKAEQAGRPARVSGAADPASSKLRLWRAVSYQLDSTHLHAGEIDLAWRQAWAMLRPGASVEYSAFRQVLIDVGLFEPPEVLAAGPSYWRGEGVASRAALLLPALTERDIALCYLAAIVPSTVPLQPALLSGLSWRVLRAVRIVADCTGQSLPQGVIDQMQALQHGAVGLAQLHVQTPASSSAQQREAPNRAAARRSGSARARDAAAAPDSQPTAHLTAWDDRIWLAAWMQRVHAQSACLSPSQWIEAVVRAAMVAQCSLAVDASLRSVAGLPSREYPLDVHPSTIALHARDSASSLVDMAMQNWCDTVASHIQVIM